MCMIQEHSWFVIIIILIVYIMAKQLVTHLFNGIGSFKCPQVCEIEQHSHSSVKWHIKIGCLSDVILCCLISGMTLK